MRSVAMDTSETTIRKWGKVLAPIILAAAASSYRLSITEPIEFEEKAEHYLEQGGHDHRQTGEIN